MNNENKSKRQLLVILITVILLCLVILFAPVKYVFHGEGGRTRAYDNPREHNGLVPEIQWGFVLQRSLVVLLVGGTLIYIFRNKK